MDLSSVTKKKIEWQPICGAERQTTCEGLARLFAPFFVLPYEQIQKSLSQFATTWNITKNADENSCNGRFSILSMASERFRQIAEFSYFIVDSKTVNFAVILKNFATKTRPFCRQLFSSIKSSGKNGQFCCHFCKKCRQKQAVLKSLLIDGFGKLKKRLVIMHNRTNISVSFRIFPGRTKRQVYRGIGLAYNGRILGRSIFR